MMSSEGLTEATISIGHVATDGGNLTKLTVLAGTLQSGVVKVVFGGTWEPSDTDLS